MRVGGSHRYFHPEVYRTKRSRKRDSGGGVFLLRVAIHVSSIGMSRSLSYFFNIWLSFRYCNKHVHKNGDKTTYRYTCAQDVNRQNKPKKNPEKKQRPKKQMTTFDCHGCVAITLNNEEGPEHADITVTHIKPHVPYCWISLPNDVRALIEVSLNRTPAQVSQHPRDHHPSLLILSTSQIWEEVLTHHPRPKFTRDSVYQLWHNLVEKRWVQDADEVVSAFALLQKAETEGGLGPNSTAFETIDLDVPEGLSALAFAIPEMVDTWKGRIREVAIDSACEYCVVRYS